MSFANATPVFSEADLAAAVNPAIFACYRYWQAKRAALVDPRLLPGRQHIDPIEMARFLPYVVLFDIEQTAARFEFRHRLIGTHITEIFGRELTGRQIEEAGAFESIALVRTRFSAVTATKYPAYGVSPTPVRDREFLEYEHLTLPLANDGSTVNMLFGVRCLLLAVQASRRSPPYASLHTAR